MKIECCDYKAMVVYSMRKENSSLYIFHIGGDNTVRFAVEFDGHVDISSGDVLEMKGEHIGWHFRIPLFKCKEWKKR